MYLFTTSIVLTLGSFHYAKFQNKSLEWIKSHNNMTFFSQIWPTHPKSDFFFMKTMNISSMHLLTPFIVQNFKKNASSGSRVIRPHYFLAQSGPFAKNEIFFRKTINNFQAPLGPLHCTKFQKNTFKKISKKLPERKLVRQRDKPLFIGPFQSWSVL